MSQTNPPKESSVRSCDELHQHILEDVHDMLDFARAEGKTVPEEVRAKVARLCAEEAETSPAGDAPARAVQPAQSTRATGGRSISLALDIHGALSLLVAPATPRTIRASRSTGRWKIVADNITVKFLLLISILSLIVFLIVALMNAQISLKQEAAANLSTTTNASLTTLSNPPATTLARQSKWNAAADSGVLYEIYMLFAAASLGSAFYGLYTAHKYLVSCTFDPKYHQVYLIRYVLGLTSGTILGFFGRDFFQADGISKQLGMAVLALIGGYAAEAVSQILQRFSETLVTIVRGSNADVLQARQEELKARAKQQETQTKAELSKGLLKVKETAIAANVPLHVREEMQKVIDSLSK